MEYYNVFFKRFGYFTCNSDIDFERFITNCVLYYGDDPASFKTEINQFNKLRSSVCLFENNNFKDDKKYFCQLQFLKARASQAGIYPKNEFSWEDPSFNEKLEECPISLEEACLLYNIALKIPQCVKHNDFKDNDAYLRALCISFQKSSGCFDVLGNYTDNFGVRLNTEHYRMCSSIFLIFAQICVYLKCRNDFSPKSPLPLVIAYLIEQFTNIKQEISKSQTKKQLLQYILNWADGNENYFKCQLSLFNARKEIASREYGRALRFYRNALKSIKLCENSRFKEIIPDFHELKKLSAKIKEEHDSATKTNDFVYYQSVPDSLDFPISGKQFVQSIKFEVYDSAECGPDLFARLVSLKSYEISSIYSEQKAQVLRSIKDDIFAQESKIYDAMTGFNVKIVEDIIKGRLGDLSERITKCMLYSDQNNPKYDQLIAQQSDLGNVLEEIQDQIKTISKKIAELTKMTVTLTKHNILKNLIMKDKLEGEIRKFDMLKNNHDSLAETDSQIHTALEQLITILSLLKDRRALKSHLTDPTSFIDKEIMADAYTFQELNEQIVKLTAKKEELVNALREDMLKDDLTQRLAQNLSEPDSEFFEKRLALFGPQIKSIREKMDEQDDLFSQLSKQHLKMFYSLKDVYESKEAREDDEADIERRLHMIDEVIFNAGEAIKSRNMMKHQFEEIKKRLSTLDVPNQSVPSRSNNPKISQPVSRLVNPPVIPVLAPPQAFPRNLSRVPSNPDPRVYPNIVQRPQNIQHPREYLMNLPVQNTVSPMDHYNPVNQFQIPPHHNQSFNMPSSHPMRYPPHAMPMDPFPINDPVYPYAQQTGVSQGQLNKFANIHENPYFKRDMKNQPGSAHLPGQQGSNKPGI